MNVSTPASPPLSPSQLAALAEIGEERSAPVGELLYRVGDRTYPFVAILEGEVAIIDTAGNELIRHGPSGFLGEHALPLVRLTPVGVLDRDKQLGVVKELTEIVAAAAGDPNYRERTWVLITESPEGGWGIAGHANTNADIAAAARAALAAG
jgi:phenylpyruvate tautomerase PptA (4-oxalocrotonate tautomerase family)